MDLKKRFYALVDAKKHLLIAKRTIQKHRFNFSREEEEELCVKVEECLKLFNQYSQKTIDTVKEKDLDI